MTLIFTFVLLKISCSNHHCFKSAWSVIFSRWKVNVIQPSLLPIHLSPHASSSKTMVNVDRRVVLRIEETAIVAFPSLKARRTLKARRKTIPNHTNYSFAEAKGKFCECKGRLISFGSTVYDGVHVQLLFGYFINKAEKYSLLQLIDFQKKRKSAVPHCSILPCNTESSDVQLLMRRVLMK